MIFHIFISLYLKVTAASHLDIFTRGHIKKLPIP